MSSNSELLKTLSTENSIFLNFDLKLCAILLLIILTYICFSSVTALCIKPPKYEYFSNDKFYTYKNINYVNFTTVPLTACEEKNDNILFGQATRVISSDVDYKQKDTQNKPIYFGLNVTANLYILGGNVYDASTKQTLEQKYSVKLLNPKDKKSLILGDLVKDGDGIYKLNYKIDLKKIDPSTGDIMDYNLIQIVYNAKDVITKKEINNSIVICGDLNKTP